MSTLWSRTGGRASFLSRVSRRTIFELHGGRGVPKLPSDLLLERLSPSQEPDLFLDFSTTEDIIIALGPIGIEYRPPSAFTRNRIDKSYVTNIPLLYEDREEAIKLMHENRKNAETHRSEGADQLTIKKILIQYLRHVDPILRYQTRSKGRAFADRQLDDALLKVFTEENVLYLEIKRRDVLDLMNFTWILTSETTERAAKRLWALVVHHGSITSGGLLRIPLFVFNMLLRRHNLSAEALRSLLAFAWEVTRSLERKLEPGPSMKKLGDEVLRARNTPNGRIYRTAHDSYPGMTERSFIVMIIRLLRSACKVMPAACDSIAALTVKYLDGFNFRKRDLQIAELTPDDIAGLSFKYNVLLKLVSVPASIGPFESAFYQQQAQFCLLRKMNQIKPPLIVDRQGYRAVISMQLRHKKTLKEREWATMKAKSWPPWKEEKLGIDADIGVEHGISRAMEALKQSWEAGYVPDGWDATASVLSGWDIDKSPTIQTRAVNTEEYLARPRNKVGLWASRIRATRTLSEAWSCFLSFRNQKKSSEKLSKVYIEMFRKIAFDANRIPSQNANRTSLNDSREQQPLPGDGLEVWAAPESPQEAIYVREPPPTLDEFLETIRRDKIQINSFHLAVMLDATTTFKHGLQYLEVSILPAAEVRVLCEGKQPTSSEDQVALENIGNNLFASWIRHCTRFSPENPDRTESEQSAPVQTGLALDSNKLDFAQPDGLPNSSAQSLKLERPIRFTVRNPLFEAINLTLARKPRYRPVWYNLIQALGRRKVVMGVFSRRVDQRYQDLKTWEMICKLLDEMRKIDLTHDKAGFMLICTALEKAIFASTRLSRSLYQRRENNVSIGVPRTYEDHILSTGVSLVKELFRDIFGSNSMQQEFPIDSKQEKSSIDETVQKEVALEFDVVEVDLENRAFEESSAFIPPGCLLPRLLETPSPWSLFPFIRVLGHSRDYEGLSDLIEWMSLFSDEINLMMEQSAKGERMMRRCLTAVRVFLERSWIVLEKQDAVLQGTDVSDIRDEIELNAEPAPAAIVETVRNIVESHEEWGGWPQAEEVVMYCAKSEFIRKS